MLYSRMVLAVITLLALSVGPFPHGIHQAASQSSKVRIGFDFRLGLQGWEAGFADYSPAHGDLALRSGLQGLPAELGSPGTGFYIQGINRSDDLFMFLKRRLGPEDGIEPNQTYQVVFGLTLASNAPSGCIGVGGSPGESVTLKAGAGPIEPVVELIAAEDMFRMNVNKGNQENGGPAASVVSDIANGLPCEEVVLAEAPYLSLFRLHLHLLATVSNDRGELWLLVGTDSGFESLTGLYYQQIEVLLVPVERSQ